MFTSSPPAVDVVIALGSNEGDRAELFRNAARDMQRQGVVILRHACLYETAPMHVTDQARFLNSAVLARTHLEPDALLATLKQIEVQQGRQLSAQRWGPRPLDLDIIFYGQHQINTESLVVPHCLYRERPFVLAPVADLLHSSLSPSHAPLASPSSQAPEDTARGSSHLNSNGSLINEDMEEGVTGEGDVNSMLRRAAEEWEVMSRDIPIGGEDIRRVLPVGDSFWEFGKRTRIMGILNITPDSFSDGGQYDCTERAVQRAVEMVSEGADIIDVGGQSTRPGATKLTAQEELDRVLPVLRELKGKLGKEVAISVDTFYASVAKAAVEAGVDIINDVSGGTMDPDMLPMVGALDRPVVYVMMHIRGDPSTMGSLEHTTYGDVCAEVGNTLALQAEKAVALGVMPWQLWFDPGLGFSKKPAQSLELIRNLPEVRRRFTRKCLQNAPMLLGPSRKGFLGKISGHKLPEDRDVASAAACVACTASGTDVVRVHNIPFAKDAIKVADAIWRI
eukprot:CAMPEP_0196570508 /NCGR_PEP_ID=MMETSP1081-20130531/631_1 /TAXON_ID=36882 /ORGANISM="Pyramimonas amylifera, Strain CCMP720" /LENGTH=506 /DNA_ID=CAMNT_0041886999 /DNA_START=209 /DNA_END=1729 /DNA_ORIENTATION=-